MVQSMDFVLYANRNQADKERIYDALSSEAVREIVVDRHKLTFDPATQFVTVERASEDVPFACKIIKCRLPYAALSRLLDGDWSDLTGLEWLY